MKGLIWMIRGILFDLDGTLLNRSVSLHQFIKAQYERNYAMLTNVKPQHYFDDFITYDQNGYNHKKNVYQSLVEKYELDHHVGELLLEDYYFHFHEHCLPIEGFDHLIHYLKQSQLQLGLITNGETEFQRNTINALALADVFHCILISEEEGIKKPSPEIFQRGLYMLGVTANKTIFVGDHPTNDIKAAKKSGMCTIWVYNSHYEKPSEADFTVHSLVEIPDIITSLNKEDTDENK
ncbi:HAD family hydrolase [Alkalihalobacillus sp. TS-13]|uniref:HAD family hydrolase n=1 Tax=Alkalihalobacillus sp. TS-13 TaxID=2842455 RepID=UPI001C8675EB|nr:HAD family hydrolase [Alkalihalobacillus sp. TS-13]